MLSLNYRYHVQDLFFLSTPFRPDIELYLKTLQRCMESLYARAFKIIGIRV